MSGDPDRSEAERRFDCPAYGPIAGRECARRWASANPAGPPPPVRTGTNMDRSHAASLDPAPEADAPPGLFWCGSCPAGQDRAAVLLGREPGPRWKEEPHVSERVDRSLDLALAIVRTPPEERRGTYQRHLEEHPEDAEGSSRRTAPRCPHRLVVGTCAVCLAEAERAAKPASPRPPDPPVTTRRSRRPRPEERPRPTSAPVICADPAPPAAPGLDRVRTTPATHQTVGRPRLGLVPPCKRCGKGRGAVSVDFAGSPLGDYCSSCRGNAKIKARADLDRAGEKRGATDGEILAKLLSHYAGPNGGGPKPRSPKPVRCAECGVVADAPEHTPSACARIVAAIANDADGMARPIPAQSAVAAEPVVSPEPATTSPEPQAPPGRDPNPAAPLPTRSLKLHLTAPALALVEDLHRSGLWGRTVEDVCERLICDGLIRLRGTA